MAAEDSQGHQIERASTTPGLPVAPSMGPGLEALAVARQTAAIGGRVALIAAVAVGVGIASAFVAQGLTRLIGLITNLAFYGRLSTAFVSPADNRLGGWVVVVPVVGALLVGLMARYGSKAIRGHGIPEAMEQVLTNQSRIPARLTFLKPLSACISIGTGGPFGAEGPIIATGGALGSLVGQLLSITADERKTLLAAGAAAGMAATFGSPVAAVLLAVELLLFEYRPQSVIPVALACAAATGVRIVFVGVAPAFAITDIVQPHGFALAGYVVLGALVGAVAVGVTKLVYAVEDRFDHLPIHWMWWPAIGAIPVGVIGRFAPRTLGVGYDNIEQILSGTLAGRAMVVLCAWKLVSWSLSLGSGTSGGTLAPLFTIGGGLGALLAGLVPGLGLDGRVGALVGMAAIFAGSSRAMLTSVVFAFETTRQPLGLLPLLGGCSAAYLVSCLLMRNSIMTEKIVRRGVRVPAEYVADFLTQVRVRDVALRTVVTLSADVTVADARAFIASDATGASHQGFPVVGADGKLIGVITRRDLSGGDAELPVRGRIRRAPVVAPPDASLREAADLMVHHRVGRLPVIAEGELVGIVTRSDLLDAHQGRLAQAHRAEGGLRRAIRTKRL